MISPFEVYIILQLDALKSMLDLAGVISTVAFVLSAFVLFFHTVDESPAPAVIVKTARYALVVVISALLLHAVLPSSKTAAAMFVLPAVVNNETVQGEAAELYGLAKQAFARLATDDPEPEEEAK